MRPSHPGNENDAFAGGATSEVPGKPENWPRWYWPRSVYIHIPFCVHRCCYCDFAVVTGADRLVDPYLEALDRELALSLPEPVQVETIYIGGGTPSLLSGKQLVRLLETIRRYFHYQIGEVEYSWEANPADITEDKLRLWAEYGVNRLSLGAQSFEAEVLRFLERQHDAATIERAVERAKRYMRQISLDLIFAVPGQTLSQWERDLRRALDLQLNHLSTYNLTLEPKTALWARVKRGLVKPYDDETERAFFTRTIEVLEAAGWDHYEISNFARPGFESRHNQVYWAGEAYFGFGLGAARFVRGTRQTNTRSFRQYLTALAENCIPVAESETLSPLERAAETAALQLRRRRGIDRREFERQTGFPLDVLLGPVMERMGRRGWLAQEEDRVFLTREGIFYADEVCAECIAAGLHLLKARQTGSKRAPRSPDNARLESLVFPPADQAE